MAVCLLNFLLQHQNKKKKNNHQNKRSNQKRSHQKVKKRNSQGRRKKGLNTSVVLFVPKEKEEGSEGGDESETEVAKGLPDIPPVQPQSQVNKNADAQKSEVPPPQSPDSEGEQEEKDEKESESPQYSRPISPAKPTAEDSKPTSKRPSEEQKDDQKDARSQKKAKFDDDELKKNKPSAVSMALASGGRSARRVWSDEDVIDLLECMIAYKDEKGAEPSDHMTDFYAFLKGKLRLEVSRTQVYDKIRRLRKKFFNYVKKSRGNALVLSNPLESKAFDLSKKIWGGKAGKSGKVVRSAGNVIEVKKTENVGKGLFRDRDENDFESKYPFLSQSFDFVVEGSIAGDLLKQNMSLIGDAKARELESRWKELRKLEAELLLEKLDYKKELTNMVLEGAKEM